MALKRFLLTALRVTLFFGIGFTILYLLYKSQNEAYQKQCKLDGISAEDCNLLQKIFVDFLNTDMLWIFLMLLAFMLSNISRALRWNMLIHPMGFRPRLINSFQIVMLGYFANLGLPRLGEIVRAGALAKYEKIPPEKVMGTVVADRALDVLALLLFIGLAFLLEFDTLVEWLRTNAGMGEKGSLFTNPWFLAVMTLMLLGLIIAYIYRQKIAQISFFQKLIGLVKGFWEGITSLRRIKQPGWLIFHSIFIWVMYYMMAYLCFFAFEPTSQLSATAALMVFVFGAFGIVIPSPGGMGTYHFLVIAALALYGIRGDDAFSFANIIYFTIQIFGNALFGIIALLTLPAINRHYNPEPQKEASVEFSQL